jgi:site-specific DNA recombinase
MVYTKHGPAASNEKYFGNVTLIKTIISGRIGSKIILNDGQADKYMVIANHPPIIEKEVFDLVQRKNSNAAILK